MSNVSKYLLADIVARMAIPQPAANPLAPRATDAPNPVTSKTLPASLSWQQQTSSRLAILKNQGSSDTYFKYNFNS